jgi:von Willebrand factor type A domain-containing protein
MKNYVKIVNIIDRSGSMGSMIDTAIGGFNEFLQEQQNIEGDALVSTMLFSSKFHNLYENSDIQECKFLNKDNYIPNGTTALYDAIGRTIDNEIDQLGNLPKEERPEKTLCVILTDGYENASRKFTKEQIKEKISEMKEDFNWEFIFLAANEDASLTAETMGISKGNSYAFTNSSTGLKDAYTAVSFATTSYRQSKSTSLDDVMDDYRDKE